MVRKLCSSGLRYWIIEFLRTQPKEKRYHALILRFIKDRNAALLLVEVDYSFSVFISWSCPLHCWVMKLTWILSMIKKITNKQTKLGHIANLTLIRKSILGKPSFLWSCFIHHYTVKEILGHLFWICHWWEGNELLEHELVIKLLIKYIPILRHFITGNICP